MLKNYFHDLLSLFFPELCTACGKNLFKNEVVICTTCIYNLPKTDFHLDDENRVARQLWGRFPFVQAISYLFFQKGGKVQSLMHQLKYNNSPQTGFRMGELYGYELKRSVSFKQPDLIIPVPLHSKRLKKRGYNQSEHIANGLGSILNVQVIVNNLQRFEATDTQTKKNRFARYENLKGAFQIKNPVEFISKHILLVDDVVTTGATLEACSLELLKINGVSISIATIAFAE